MNRGSSSLLSLFQQGTEPGTTPPPRPGGVETTEMSALSPSTPQLPTLEVAVPALNDMDTRQTAVSAATSPTTTTRTTAAPSTTTRTTTTARVEQEEFNSGSTIVDMSQSGSFESSGEEPVSLSSLSLQDSIQCHPGKSSNNHPFASLRHSQSQGFGQQQQSHLLSPTTARHGSPAHLQHSSLESQFDIYEDENDIKTAVKEFKLQSNLSLYYEDENGAATTSYLTSHSWDPTRALALSGRITNLPAGSGPSRRGPSPTLGTLKGVFLPCLQNIFGIILFVRLPWITGMAGVGLSLVIVLMAVACTFLTTISMSAIATNGHVPAGGPYYMISRSLGKELGVSVGILFYLTNACGTAMYILGAIEILLDNIAPQMAISTISENNARLYGSVLLLFLTIVTLFGMRNINRFAIVFLACVFIAILSILVGLFASNRPGLPTNEVLGFPGDLGENFGPGFDKPDMQGTINSDGVDFIKLFAIFFPSVTGIMAGSNRSGDLKNAGKSIPAGTLSAVGVSTIVYVAFVLLFGTVTAGAFLRTKLPPNGLHVSVVAWPHPLLVLIGCLLSSVGAALQCLTGGPRLLQAVAKDDIVPILAFFKTTYRGEPTRALIMTYLIAQMAVLVGSLDAIAPITTMLYLVCYAFVNFSTALLSLLQYPNWRPTWHLYHWSVSLLGAILCIVYMFLINYIFALVALGLVAVMYKYIEYRGAQVEWGDGMIALNLSVAQKNLLALERTKHVHPKNWRPQVMTLLDLDKDLLPKDPVLLSFLAQLRKGGGLSIVTSILEGDLLDSGIPARFKEHRDILSLLMKEHGIRGFSQTIVSTNPLESKLSAIQAVGVGVLRPNSILVSYPTRWRKQSRVENNSFVHLIRSVIANDKVFMILKADNKDHPYPSIRSMPLDSRKTIDVYWIMHDGGILTVLPFILQKSRVWKKCRQRIFCIAQEDDNSFQMKRDLEHLLSKYRIEAEAHIVEMENHDISEFTYEKTLRMQQRDELLQEMQLGSKSEVMVTAPTVGLGHKRRPDKQKTEFMNTSVKLNSRIKQNSADAGLIFLSLPAPTRSQSSYDYLEYLDALTADLPRVVLIKGSGMEVVTAYF